MWMDKYIPIPDNGDVHLHLAVAAVYIRAIKGNAAFLQPATRAAPATNDIPHDWLEFPNAPRQLMIRTDWIRYNLHRFHPRVFSNGVGRFRSNGQVEYVPESASVTNVDKLPSDYHWLVFRDTRLRDIIVC